MNYDEQTFSEPEQATLIRLTIPQAIVADFDDTKGQFTFALSFPVSDKLHLPVQEMHKALRAAAFTDGQAERIVGAMLDACDHEQALIALGQYVK